MEDNLLYSMFTNLNVNLIQNHLHRNIQKMSDHISGDYSLTKLMHKLTITGMIAKDSFFLRWWKCSKIDCGNGWTCLWIHKNIKLNSLNRWIVYKWSLNKSVFKKDHHSNFHILGEYKKVKTTIFLKRTFIHRPPEKHKSLSGVVINQLSNRYLFTKPYLMQCWIHKQLSEVHTDGLISCPKEESGDFPCGL